MDWSSGVRRQGTPSPLPSPPPGTARGRRFKRDGPEAIAAEINFVEIDLTRSGTRELSFPHLKQPARTNTAYLTCVCHGGGCRQMDVYPTPLSDRLPRIRVPSRPNDPDAALDLQALVDSAYEEGRYDDIDYAGQPVPPFAQEDAAWADQLLRAAGKRLSPSIS